MILNQQSKLEKEKQIIKVRLKIKANIKEMENRKTNEKIDDRKSQLFEKINKISKFLMRLIRRKKEMTNYQNQE